MALPVAQISLEIRKIYRDDPDSAANAVETYLESMLKELPVSEKHEVLRQVAEHIVSAEQTYPVKAAGAVETAQPAAAEPLLHFISLLLGREVEYGEFSTEELQQRLSDSLNGIFNGLNQLLSAIAQTMRQDGMVDETIRQVVREQLAGGNKDSSLEDHINRIREAFFLSYESFKSAHEATLDKILAELDPERILHKNNGGLKFGPLRKAEAYDQFVRTYNNLKSWHETGRGLEEFLRAFEKHCCETTPK